MRAMALARVQAALDGALIGRLSAYVTPVLLTWVMLVLCYKLFPTTRVRWVPAMVGAALAAVGFEIVKFGFNVYVAQALLSGYNQVPPKPHLPREKTLLMHASAGVAH